MPESDPSNYIETKSHRPGCSDASPTYSKSINDPELTSILLDGQKNIHRNVYHQNQNDMDHGRSNVYEPNPNEMEDHGHSDIKWRHSGWMPRRRKLLASLERVGLLGRFSRVSTCGDKSYVFQCKATGEIRIKASHCHDKLCVPCSIQRGRIISENLQKQMMGNPNAKYGHIVLTLKHSNDPLSAQLDRLNESFSKLRRSKLWTSCILGGYSVMEITRSKSGQWHPHIHCIAETTGTISSTDLSAVWMAICACTGPL